MQRDRHHIEVRHPLARPALMEPFELFHQRHAVAGPGICRHFECSVGKHHLAHAHCLGARRTYCLPSKRFHITATYVVSFIALSFVRTAFTGHSFLAEVAPITGPMYQLFIFFMITDPKTTVKPRWAQCLVAFLVAVVEMILRLAENVHAPYYALAIVGPIANAIEIGIILKRSPETHLKPSPLQRRFGAGCDCGRIRPTT